jgi:hypothetical protein
MATIKTTSKTNPITGMSTDNNPRKEARQERREVKRDTRALNKTLDEGIKKQGRVKQYYQGVPSTPGVPAERKSRLERQMEEYSVKPANPKNYSPREQKDRNKTQLKLAKARERASIPTPGMDKVRDKVNKVLGRGKYDRGSSVYSKKKKGDFKPGSQLCVDKFGQRSQDKACNMKMGEKFGRTGKKTPKNTQWTLTK